ncbi:hypothetical protein HF576_01850 [Microbacterium sp. CFH 90308]|uniref:Uncharacterized protein n=1 Tax=Microbacterium salsuginis TaxID=2722803 RepID=A0ABX1K7T2_9MICO|nr:hypothetical protein [Microbacterium sp. CFH 90308]NLP82582.1 hypothetical protein [Microbacterium sp. CFH 90308]
MAIISKGYEGTVNYADWAVLTSHLGAQYSVFGPDAYAVSFGSGDREVLVAPGRAAGQGILDDSDAPVSLVGATVGSGSRWDLIALRRDWTTSETIPVLVQGASTAAIPAGREDSPGSQDDQPLALVRFAAGQTAPQEVIDLRCWHGDGGMAAKSLLVRDYLTRIGTRVWVQGITWVLGFNALGLPTWVPDSVYVGATAPPYSENLLWAKP